LGGWINRFRPAKECINNGARLEQPCHGSQNRRPWIGRPVEIRPGGGNPRARPVGEH